MFHFPPAWWYAFRVLSLHYDDIVRRMKRRIHHPHIKIRNPYSCPTFPHFYGQFFLYFFFEWKQIFLSFAKNYFFAGVVVYESPRPEKCRNANHPSSHTIQLSLCTVRGRWQFWVRRYFRCSIPCLFYFSSKGKNDLLRIGKKLKNCAGIAHHCPYSCRNWSRENRKFSRSPFRRILHLTEATCRLVSSEETYFNWCSCSVGINIAPKWVTLSYKM